jgi:hypothetical protein
MTGNPQNAAQLIADALHALEADPAVKNLPRRAKVKLARLHRMMHEAALDHGPSLGVDVAPLSGGGVKPS